MKEDLRKRGKQQCYSKPQKHQEASATQIGTSPNVAIYGRLVGPWCYKRGKTRRASAFIALSTFYKFFTLPIFNRIDRTLYEEQQCEQLGFLKEFIITDHMPTITSLIEVSRAYKIFLSIKFMDLKKPFDTVETEAVLEALGNQGVPTQYIRIFRELYSNFTTKILPFYNNIIIDVRREVRQGGTVSPKLFSATLEDVM
ncbi:hypothetical protein ANCCEY_12844 [Ancylostoma ceylanicum]|uniref:Uncharacterized protein n=1 Tax=Ancylostoma ceylanicum TaxID=53326 RepID=A0A0D6L8T5_9BILA|nr:hypothetical protein ANCCEY_12844 [Ancylostoma ceylanicum]